MFDAFDLPDVVDFISWKFVLFVVVICSLRFYLKGAQFSGKVKAKGKVVVITGGNCGIGKQIVRELLYRNATVYMGCRDEERGNQAKVELFKLGCSPEKLILLKLDLASFASVEEFVKEISKRTDHVDILINNAGIMTYTKFRTTADGHEVHWQVNYLGHFLLTELLLPLLKAAPDEARIVNVSAQAHYAATLNLHTIDTKDGYDAREAYSRSKLALVEHARHLTKVLRKSGANVTINACNPGIAYTRLLRHTPMMTVSFLKYTLGPVAWFLMKTPKDGAQTPLYCALSREIAGVSGKYFHECKEKQPSEEALDDTKCEHLYKFSRIECKVSHAE